MLSKIAILASLVAGGHSQLAGTEQAEVHPKLTWQKCTAPGSCSNVAGSIVVDANWRWAHGKGGYTNCYTGNAWNQELCPDNEACAANCEIEGADYASTYGITTSGNAVSLKFVTPNSSGTNVGSRVYLLADDENYEMFAMNGNEIAFDVENGEIGCGLNGAVYFVSMDEDGGKARSPGNKAGAKYGTGYCDSQCARDLKWIDGKVCVPNRTAGCVFHALLGTQTNSDRATPRAGSRPPTTPTPGWAPWAPAVPRWTCGRPTACRLR